MIFRLVPRRQYVVPGRQMWEMLGFRREKIGKPTPQTLFDPALDLMIKAVIEGIQHHIWVRAEMPETRHGAETVAKLAGGYPVCADIMCGREDFILMALSESNRQLLRHCSRST